MADQHKKCFHSRKHRGLAEKPPEIRYIVTNFRGFFFWMVDHDAPPLDHL